MSGTLLFPRGPVSDIMSLRGNLLKLDVTINSIPLELGRDLKPEELAIAGFSRAGLLRRLVAHQSFNGIVYECVDCELRCFQDQIHIYPCTDGYLNRDRQWHTRVMLVVEDGKLSRVFFQVVEARTAATNFLQRFQNAAAGAVGEPVHRDQQRTVWQRSGTLIQTYLHPDRMNADFELALSESETQ